VSLIEYQDEASTASRTPFWFIEIAGIGHQNTSGASATRWSTWDPPSSYTGNAAFKSYLKEAPRYTYDSINPGHGSSDAGSMSFTLIDFDDDLTNAFSYLRGGVPVTGVDGQYPSFISEDVDRTETIINVHDESGISANTHYIIDNEAVFISSTAAGSITVVRGELGTAATRHVKDSPILLSPISPRGLQVTLYRNFQNLTSDEETIRWVGTLRDAQQTGPGSLEWIVSCSSILQATRVPVMRRTGKYTVTRRHGNRDILELYVTNDGRELQKFADAQSNIYITTSSDAGFINVDKVSDASEVSSLRFTGNDANGLQHAQLHMSDPEEWKTNQDDDVTVWEVAPTNPRIPSTRFGYKDTPFSTLVVRSHPFYIALNWMVSVLGDSTNLTGTRSYDILPEGWGAEIDASLVDFDSFERLVDKHPIENPNFCYGIEGGAFDLRDHLERELLGPYSCYLTQKDGKISLVEYTTAPAWNNVNATTITHADILEPPTLQPDLGESVQQVRAKSGYSWMDERFSNEVEAHQRQTPTWALRTGREVEMDLYGTARSATASSVEQYLTAFLWRNRIPPAHVALSVHDTLEHTVNVGDTVRLTSAILSNLSTGARGVSTFSHVVVSKEVNDTTVDLQLVARGGDVRVANISPSLQIISIVSSSVFNISQNKFTTDGEYPNTSRDASWFIVGDEVAIYSGVHGEQIGTTTISILTGSQVTVSPAVGAADAQDYIGFPLYDDASDENQQEYGHYSSGMRLGGTNNDPPYIYVG